MRNRHKGELEHILTDSFLSSGFLECLSDKKEWKFLYPSKMNEGVSVQFFESYWKVIRKEKLITIAQYISGLVMKYRDAKDMTILNKTDAYEIKNDYASLLNRILLRATEKDDWSMSYQLSILDAPEQLPVLYRCTQIHKLIHFYYQKGASISIMPMVNVKDTTTSHLCVKIIKLLEQTSEYQRTKIIDRILNFRYGDKNNDVDSSILDELLIENAWKEGIYRLYPLFYTMGGIKNVYGICSLLRLYYMNKEDLSSWEDEIDSSSLQMDPDIKKWLDRINNFTCQYIDDRFQSVVDKSKYAALCEKIKRSIPRSDLRLQIIWFHSIMQRLNESGKEWNEYDLVYDPWGNYAFKTFLFAFRLKLNEISFIYFNNNLINE